MIRIKSLSFTFFHFLILILILKFVQENLIWIKNQIDKIPTKKKFNHGETIEILGQPVIIIHNPNSKQGCHIHAEQLIVSGDKTHIHRRIRDFIKHIAYIHIQKKALDMAKRLGEKPTRITLKDTSSRWGSCSSTKHLSFCWKLALAPEFVLDYIIAHEVSHLKEMNHSNQFWETVGTLGVRRADAQIWLRKHGAELQAWE